MRQKAYEFESHFETRTHVQFKTRTRALNQRGSASRNHTGLTLHDTFLIHKLTLRGGVKGVQTGVQSGTAVKTLSSVFM